MLLTVPAVMARFRIDVGEPVSHWQEKVSVNMAQTYTLSKRDTILTDLNAKPLPDIPNRWALLLAFTCTQLTQKSRLMPKSVVFVYFPIARRLL
jgi:hypothetical protein